MIVTKTPLRISFFGGGSDIPQFYEKHYGVVISTTIDKHIYIAANICVANHIKLVYSEMEYPNSVEDIKHNRIKEILKYFNISSNIEIASFSDVPTKGTGLGSSSTFTVGVISAISQHLGIKLNKKQLAELACEIEINRCGEPIGKQDQYAATYGGFNILGFDKNSVAVIPYYFDEETLKKLENNLFAYNTGINRLTSSILSKQVDSLKTDGNTFNNTKKMVDLTQKAIFYLEKNDIDTFGSLLDETWNLKKTLAENISNEVIDNMYASGIKSGAIGGKLLGAGGGGYMLFYVPEQNHDKFLHQMKKYEKFNFKFVDYGTKTEMFSK